MKSSALMVGPVAQLAEPANFPFENVLINRDRYSYEGNWLFCSFDQPDVLAARIGFGLGRFHWQDYGLEPQDVTVPVAYRLEVITPEGVVRPCLYSDPHLGSTVCSDPSSMDVRFRAGGADLFAVRGWPEIEWKFRSPDGAVAADLRLALKNMALWPDCIMPNNTLAMCIGVGRISGTFSFGDRVVEVSGGGVYDHPRVVVQSNEVAPFGWYLYAPLRFPDGSFVVSYFAEDGLGVKSVPYSTGFLTLPDGSSRWLRDVQVRGLKFDADGLPVAWETQLRGEGVAISYRTRVVPTGCVGTPGAAGKYLAFPILMDAEGECSIDDEIVRLERGSGIAEFLARKGYQPVYP
jgi:hypothetical protein